MIRTILMSVVMTSNKEFSIKEIYLGQNHYNALKKEIESTITGVEVDINKINKYAGIPVMLHGNNDVIHFVLTKKPE